MDGPGSTAREAASECLATQKRGPVWRLQFVFSACREFCSSRCSTSAESCDERVRPVERKRSRFERFSA